MMRYAALALWTLLAGATIAAPDCPAQQTRAQEDLDTRVRRFLEDSRWSCST